MKMVLEWLTSAFRRFCLCDSMAGQLGGLSSFIFYLLSFIFYDYFFCLTNNDVGIGSDHLYFLI